MTARSVQTVSSRVSHDVTGSQASQWARRGSQSAKQDQPAFAHQHGRVTERSLLTLVTLAAEICLAETVVLRHRLESRELLRPQVRVG
jgi:hypothetical protein